MNTKEIIIPEGWVIDKQVDNKLILKECKSEPDDWKKCYDILFSKRELCFINEVSNIDYDLPEEPSLCWKNVFPKEYAEPILALMQLLTCYKAYVGDWKPDWNNIDIIKYCICIDQLQPKRSRSLGVQRVLAFPTVDMRDKFLETFEDLLEQAKPLL
jgi:hypothetical protein